MPASLQAGLAWYAALSLRERLLIIAALLAIAFQLADALLLQRQQNEIDMLQRDIARDNAAVVAIASELGALVSRSTSDPNAELREQLATLQVQLQRQEQQLADAAKDMISPQEMARFLEELLAGDDELSLLSLRTFDPEPLVREKAGDEARPRQPEQVVGLHRHGFEIVFTGGYLATLRYLEALERLPWRFFWDSVSYEVIDYPQSAVRLQLYTLSLSPDWIGV